MLPPLKVYFGGH